MRKAIQITLARALWRLSERLTHYANWLFNRAQR
jgi:hypothetical protein